VSEILQVLGIDVSVLGQIMLLQLEIVIFSVDYHWALDHWLLFLMLTLTSIVLLHVWRLMVVVWRISVHIGRHSLLLLWMKVVLLVMLGRVLITGREDAVGNLLVLLIRVAVMWRLTHSRHRPLLDLVLIEDWRRKRGGLVTRVVTGSLVLIHVVSCRDLGM
jgi:hypothetical protein